MAVIDIGEGLAGAVGKFTDWRNKAGERKLELKRLKAEGVKNSWGDEFCIVAFPGSFAFLLVGTFLMDIFGFNGGGTAAKAVAHANALLEGNYGYLVGAVTIAAMGIDKLSKRLWKK